MNKLVYRDDPTRVSVVQLFDRNATEDLNFAENGFNLKAMMMKISLPTGQGEVFKIPKSIGEIRMVSFRVTRENAIPETRKVPTVPCKRKKIDFYVKIDMD